MPIILGSNIVNKIIGPNVLSILAPRPSMSPKYFIFLFGEKHEKDNTVGYDCETEKNCYKLDSSFLKMINEFAELYTNVKIQFYLEEKLNLSLSDDEERESREIRSSHRGSHNEASNLQNMGMRYKPCFYKHERCPYKNINWYLTDSRFYYKDESTESTESTELTIYGLQNGFLIFTQFLLFLIKMFSLLLELSEENKTKSTTTPDFDFFMAIIQPASPIKDKLQQELINFLNYCSIYYYKIMKPIYIINLINLIHLALTDYTKFTRIILQVPIISSQVSRNTPEHFSNPNILKDIFEYDIGNTILHLQSLGFELETFLLLLENVKELFNVLNDKTINSFIVDDVGRFNIDKNIAFNLFYDKFEEISQSFTFNTTSRDNYTNILFTITSGILDIYFLLRIFKKTINNNIIFLYSGSAHTNCIKTFLTKHLQLTHFTIDSSSQETIDSSSQEIQIEPSIDLNKYFDLSTTQRGGRNNKSRHKSRHKSKHKSKKIR